MRGLGDLPGGRFVSSARGVTADGSIVVGQGNNADSLGEAFIWDAGHGMRSLRAALEADYGMDLTGWQLTAANGISADGSVIVGEAFAPSGAPEGFIVVIPEPATGLLLASGLLLLAVARR
jgi:hypothetical protein